MKPITHPAGKWLLAMGNYALLFGLILVFCTSVFGDEPPAERWVARYSYYSDVGDWATAMAVDHSGNVYVTGLSMGLGSWYDYATIKYSTDGNQLWVARYNGPGHDFDAAHALAVDNSGNVYITGESIGWGTGLDYATIKYSPDGNELWVARYNGPANDTDTAYALAVDNSGNVYVTGYSSDGTWNDYATVKYGPNGNQLWVARYNGTGNSDDVAQALAVDSSGNVYVTGYSYDAFYDYATVKYGPGGDQLWVARYNGPGNGYDYAYALAVDNSGNVYVTGQSYGGIDTSEDYATIKYNTYGNQLWVARYDGDADDIDNARVLAVDNSGNVYVTGHSYGNGTGEDYATVKYGPGGNQLWVARYDGPGNDKDEAHALAVDDCGNVYVTGESYGGISTSVDYATVKYSPGGNQLWVARYNGGGGDDAANALTVDSSGNVYVTGGSGGISTNWDYATIKYTQACYCMHDDFNTPHNYITEGVAGTGWDGFIGLGPNETVDALNADLNHPGQLYMQSTGATWQPNFTPLGPFLYKEVKGDFIATVHITDFAGTLENRVLDNDSFIMARVADINAAGVGEDFECVHYFPTWNGNMGRDIDVDRNICCGTSPGEAEWGWLYHYNDGDDTFALAQEYIQLERRGNTFYFRISEDGQTWTNINTTNSPFNVDGNSIERLDLCNLPLQVGLAHATYSGATGYVAFDDFSLIYDVLQPYARCPSPRNGVADVDVYVDLYWAPGDLVQDVNGHEVYIGTNEAAVTAATRQNHPGVDLYIVSDPCCALGALAFGTTCFWRVDEVSESNRWPGDVWYFTTDNGKARDPEPADGRQLISTLTDELRWTPGHYAVSQDLYFGTSFKNVNTRTTPDISGLAGDANKCGIPAAYLPLERGQTYFWRVDTKNGELPSTKGDIWSFYLPIIAFYDDFNEPHNFLTEGVAGTGWDGFIGLGQGETVDVLNADINRPGQLYIESTGAYWGPNFTPLGPFLYKEVAGDFVATVKVTDFAGCPPPHILHNDSFIMARVADLDAAGPGEDFECVLYFPTWVGNMGRDMDNGIKSEWGATGNDCNCASYIQLERSGNTFYFRISFDGVHWESLNTSSSPFNVNGFSIERPDLAGLPLQVGLAHATYSTATGFVAFDDFTLYEHRPVIYVDANATGANNGSSWADAYKYLQNALTAAEPTYEVWVAEGTYRPDEDTNHPGGTNNRNATFHLENSVALYGGFPSGGGLWSSRDPDTYETILSGDLAENDEPNFVNRNDNSYHVVTGSGTNSTAILDGFTITAGNASGLGGPGLSYRRGGGMYNQVGSPKVNNCTFRDNRAIQFGGGMFNYLQSNPHVTNCIFIGNTASSAGGGMHVEGGISPILTGCTFSGNSANDGGGIYVSNSYVTLIDCSFSGNSATYNGGGMYVGNTCNVTLTDCNFSDNSAAQYGSGIAAVDFLSVINLGAGGSTSTVDEFYISSNSQVQGTGSVVIELGGEMIIDSNAVVDLIDPNDPYVTGTIQCDGQLKVKDNGHLTNAKVQVSRQAGGFFGKFDVEGSAQITNLDIYSDGDRFMNVDPCTFTGSITYNRIYVTITEGQNETPEGILEVRGLDLPSPPCGPNVPACQIDSNIMPEFDTNSWTLERLEVAAGAKVTLMNRFSSGNGDPEVLYVKNLILHAGCVLNIGLGHLYYVNLTGDPNLIKLDSQMGFSLDKMDFDSNEEFEKRVENNNFTYPEDPNYNRVYIVRVVGLEPDPNGMMEMSNLEDKDPCSPTYGQIISARAKGEFAPAVEEEIRIRFNYLFNTTDPCAQIVVYLSDVPELLEPNDPCRATHYIEVARVSAPPVPCPGSADSNRFGNFDMFVSTDGLDLSKGTWIELELIGPASGGFMSRYNNRQIKTLKAGEIHVYVNDLKGEVSCSSCGVCLDLVYGDCLVTTADFLKVVGGTGSADPPTCMDGGFNTDGYLDTYDIASWDWTLNDIEDRQNLCPGLPLGSDPPKSGGGALAADRFASFGGPLNLLNLPDLNDLLIYGKIGAKDATKLQDRLYVFDSKYQYIQGFNPVPDRCNIRIVRGTGNDLYQINSENGVSQLDSPYTPIVPCGQATYTKKEPRYNQNATVYVGILGTADEPYGRPVLDAVFDANSVYVVPVVVVPDGKEPYTAAARLTLDQSLTVVKLYDEPLQPFDYDHPEYQLQYRNTLREIELDAAGNVYVTNAYYNGNDSDILWKFEPNGTVQRLDLDLCNPPVYAPTGLCVSSATNRLYLASSLRNDADPNSTVIYGFSTATLAPARTIKVSKMQHVTSITEDPITHSLWVAGFCFNSMPNPDPGASPFYDPYLAKVRRGENNVSAKCILDANYPKYLAMPLSIVWTGARPIPKPCGGADLNKDGKVSMKDLAILANYWLKTDCGPSNNYCKGADLEPESFPDGDVDLEDLAILVEHWLDTGCP